MASPPKVAIVVTTFNRPGYLAQALKSVIAQQWTDWSLTVHDDGNSPEVRESVERLGDRRISYHPNPDRLGIGGNKLAGWLAANGKYFVHLDDDDTWEPEFLSSLVPLLDADESLTVAFSGQYIIDTAGDIDPAATQAIQQQYRGGLAAGRHWPIARLALVDMSMPVATGSVIRRDAIDLLRLPQATNVVADYWLAYLVVRSGGAAFYDPRQLVSYRRHNLSATAAGGAVWHASFAECYRAFLDDQALREQWPVFRSRLAASERRIAALQLMAGDARGARAASRRALAAAVTPATVAVAAATLTGRVGRRAAIAASSRARRSG